MSSVVKGWISKLSWKQQTVLLSALRGCDGKSKEDISKPITRFYRHLILENADNDSGFMTGNIDEFKNIIYSSFFNTNSFNKLFKDIDCYPMHFIFHLFHAIEIIGYKCPNVEIKNYCFEIYKLFCETIHCNIESERQMDERLADNI